MKACIEREAGSAKALDYGETVELVNALFGWRPGPLTSVLIRILSTFTHPLEQGSHQGRRLPGNPHRPSWVIAGPLTVFALDGAGYGSKVMLAARLRNRGSLNIVTVGGERGRRRTNRRAAVLSRRRSETLAAIGFSEYSEGTAARGRADGLEALMAIQDQSGRGVSVIPVVRTTHQYTREAPGVSGADAITRAAPWRVARKFLSLTRTVRTGGLTNTGQINLQARRDRGTPPASQAIDGDEVAALRREISGSMVSARRACEGPPLLPARQVKRNVLADPILAAYMDDYSVERGVSQEELIAEARSYLDEIASDYRVGVVRWFARAVDYLFDRFLEDIEVDREGIRFLSSCNSRNRIVLVCSHKSYVDPLLIGYALFRSGMVPPHQAAGLNLSFWPVGWLLRHSGAFYLRRSFAGETLYREVFSAYVRYLLSSNHVCALYIEGTRSRDGKIAMPKTGFMSILADSLEKGVCRDIILVPVFLGYDKVPEEGAHVREMAGGRKVGESVKGFARIIQSVNTRLGKAYVRFGTPASLRGLLRTGGVKEAAEKITAGIDSVSPLTARSLAACSILAGADDLLSREEFLERADALLNLAFLRGTGTPSPDEVAGCLDWLAAEGRVKLEQNGGTDLIRIAPGGRRFLEYNKNMALSHFAADALVAVAGPADANASPDIDLLRDLFSEEYVQTAREEWDGLVLRSSSDLEGSGAVALSTVASLVRSSLEGYLVAASAVARLEPGSKITRDEYYEKCFREGAALREKGVPLLEESLSRVTFSNAASKWKRKGLIAQETETGDHKRSAPVLVATGRVGEAGAIAEEIRRVAGLAYGY